MFDLVIQLFFEYARPIAFLIGFLGLLCTCATTKHRRVLGFELMAYNCVIWMILAYFVILDSWLLLQNLMFFIGNVYGIYKNIETTTELEDLQKAYNLPK